MPARWARVGGLDGDLPWDSLVDLERLLVETAAAGDPRLLDAAAAWLAVHHVLVFGRRLAGMAAALAEARAPAVAGLGAMLDRAWTTALSLPDELRLRPESLAIARERCRRAPGVDARAERAWPTRLGIAKGRGVLRPHSVRPVEWVVHHVPELRVRALIGATLEAEIMIAALASHAGPPDGNAGDVPPPTVRAVARHAGVSYGGVHGAANRLVRRGMLVRHIARAQVALRPSSLALGAFGWLERA